MARDFDREATVYVWTFRGADHPGHASIKLTGVPGADRAYISWWPGAGGASKESGPAGGGASRNVSYKVDMYYEMSQDTREALEMKVFRTARTGQRQVNIATEEDEPARWVYGQAAAHKIKIPGLGATGVTFGLDLVRMYEWWQVFCFCPHPQYKFASKKKNCSGVAAAALRAGGGDQFASPPAAMLYIDPNQVATWARNIRAELDRRNAAADGVALAGSEVQLAAVQEVMSVTEWTTLSNRDMRGAVMRSDKIKKIDRLLRDYHRVTPWNEANAYNKLDILGELMDTIHYYLGHKPGAKRELAVITLGKQVLCVAKAKAKEYRTMIALDNQRILWAQKDLLVRRVI